MEGRRSLDASTSMTLFVSRPDKTVNTTNKGRRFHANTRQNVLRAITMQGSWTRLGLDATRKHDFARTATNTHKASENYRTEREAF